MTDRRKALAACIALGLLLAPLAGCAPEPGASGSGANGSGSPANPADKNPGSAKPGEKQQPEGGSWPEKNPDEAYEKHTALPADFPAAFAIPEGAAIDDAGSRAAGTWYLVLRATDAASADALWAKVVESGGFTASGEFETAEKGRAATLTSATLKVGAMTIPQSDGSVLLSYDIAGR